MFFELLLTFVTFKNKTNQMNKKTKKNPKQKPKTPPQKPKEQQQKKTRRNKTQKTKLPKQLHNVNVNLALTSNGDFFLSLFRPRKGSCSGFSLNKLFNQFQLKFSFNVRLINLLLRVTCFIHPTS